MSDIRRTPGRSRLAVVAVMAAAALLAGCGPNPGGSGPVDPGPSMRLFRVLASNPLVPTDSYGSAQRSMSADFDSAAVMIRTPGSFVTNIGVWNRSTGVTTQLTDLNSVNFAIKQPYISADGSKIFYEQNYSAIHPEDPDDPESGVMCIDVATGTIEPITLSPRLGVWEYSVSGDGETIVARSGWTVVAWRSGVLTTLGTGTVDGTQYDVHRQSLSTNGRFAAVPTSTPIGGGLQQLGLTVFDLELGTVHATWTGPTRPWNPQIIANPNEFLIRLGNVLDDGSVLFSQGNNAPLLRLDGTTGLTAPTGVADVYAVAGSANGRNVLLGGPAANDYDEITIDLQTNDVADAHLYTTAFGDWTSIGVSDDGDEILVYGQDATHVAGYYLWERDS